MLESAADRAPVAAIDREHCRARVTISAAPRVAPMILERAGLLRQVRIDASSMPCGPQRARRVQPFARST
jgi:hypothetical protein